MPIKQGFAKILTNTSFYLLGICTLLCLDACNRKDFKSQVFKLNMTAGIESLDPAYAKDLNSIWCNKMLYNTLVELDSQQNLIPSLAHSWDISADGLTYTFHLRTDVVFYNSSTILNAKHVVYSFERIMNPQIASSGAWVFNDKLHPSKPFTIDNDSTVSLHLVKPFNLLLQLLTMPYCAIVCDETYLHGIPKGTGPFTVHLWDRNNILILHKNPQYWEKGLPKLDYVHISFIDNKASEFLQFYQGKLHFLNGIDEAFKDMILSKNGTLKSNNDFPFILRKGPYLNTEYLGFNLSEPFVSNASNDQLQLIRQAMNYAINKAQIVTYFRNGIGQPANAGFTPPGLPGFWEQQAYGYTYNPEHAKQLLVQAGFPNGKGLEPIPIITPPNYADIVNFVAQQLAQIGIHLKVDVTQPALVKQLMADGKAPMFRGQWIGDYIDAETFLAFFYGPFSAPPNYTRMRNATFDSLYQQAIVTDHIEQKFTLYRQLDSIAANEAAVVPLFYDQQIHLLQKQVKGFYANSLNHIQLKYVEMEY